MSEDSAERARDAVETVYRSDSRRVLATLIRLLGDFDLAEEALHDAFAAALEQWPRDGVPDNPARLARVGRALQGDRRAAAARALRRVDQTELAERLDAGDADGLGEDRIEDDRLRLIFTCCHPALAARRAGGAHPARGLRPHHRGDRAARSSPLRPRWRSASCAPRRRSATRGSRTRCRRRAELPDRLDARAARDLPRVQRGLLRLVGRPPHAADLSGEAIRLGGCWSSCCRSRKPWGCWR